MSDGTDETTNDGGGGFSKLLMLLLIIGLGSYVMKRKREQELDEALWEEPRAL